MYDYGPPRLKLIQTIAGQPRVLAEFDVPAAKDAPDVYEFDAKFTTDKVGVTIEYAYSIPSVLENFWFQSGDAFARPIAYVDWLEIEGPNYDAWPPSYQTRLVKEIQPKKQDELAVARQTIGMFMRRAYRRPLVAGELEEKLKLFDAARADADSFLSALKAPLIAVLCSPNFLFLTEPSEMTNDGEPRKLNEHELAARLSYFLWSSMPDDALFRAASAGKLNDHTGLLQEMQRMLDDPKSSALVENFTSQWLGLREVGANPPAPDLYPHYDRHLETSMVREGIEFFDVVLRQKLSVMNFVRSDFAVVNERMARFYGVPGVRGDNFRRVPIEAKVHRGGVVTMAAVHTITSNGTRTSPVKRGTWVMKNLLGIDPGLPVANAGDIAPKVPGIDKATVRQRLEVHRTLAQCARCHAKIDPLGFALENYNACGQWRDQEGFGYKGRIQREDPQIDASSRWIDGTEIVGVAGLQDTLVGQKRLFLKCLVSKMMTYALGRELGLADQPSVEAIAERLNNTDDTLPELIRQVVLSDAFQTK